MCVNLSMAHTNGKLGSFPKQFPQTYLIASLKSVRRDPTKGELGSKLMLVSDKNIHVPFKELCEKITFCDNVAKILTVYMFIKRLYR